MSYKITGHNRKRKIAVVTGSRAEYGLLYGLIKRIQEDRDCILQLIVTGMHLSKPFGFTINDIKNDNLPIAAKLDIELSSDKEETIVCSMGKGFNGFSKLYPRLRPDIIVVLGDRFEILPAVIAASVFRIPVAHIHGGETTLGAVDELIRHAITKMSHLHFVSTQEYRRRVIQMGEMPKRVFYVGAPGLDNLYDERLMSKKELFSYLDIPQDKKVGVVTYHPVTLSGKNETVQIKEVLKAIVCFPDVFWLITSANADAGGRSIIREIKRFVKQRKNLCRYIISLGRIKYLSLLKYADLMLGNSSSALIEAPSFRLPSVNIGERQEGRVKAKNVIDVPKCEKYAIKKAVDKALSDRFRKGLKGMRNPYQRRNAGHSIFKIIKQTNINGNLIKKNFFDIK